MASRRAGKKKANGANTSLPRRKQLRSKQAWRLKGIVQGAGAAVSVPFGEGGSRVNADRCFDAFYSDHMPLPRAVGDYTVIRTTQLMTFDAPAEFSAIPTFLEICPELFTLSNSSEQTGTFWSSLVARGCDSGGMASAINAAANCFTVAMSPVNTLAAGATLVPSAVSAQIMNPSALQTTNGMVYLGLSNAQYELANDSSTWNSLANNFISYMRPRICSAAKLAMKGVQVDSYPLDMSDLANFRPLRQDSGNPAKQTWDNNGTDPARSGRPTGFAPIVIYNPNSIPLQVLVCIEWRVRFSPFNVAAATHTYHPPSSDSTWAHALQHMSSKGNGVVDIVESIAQWGTTAANAARTAGHMYRASQRGRARALGDL